MTVGAKSVDLSLRRALEDLRREGRRASAIPGNRHYCMGCERLISVTKAMCASCAEDMGYARRAR